MPEMLITCEAHGSMFLAEKVDFDQEIASILNKRTFMVLSDRQIKKIIGDVLIGADPHLISPNGIELRLGNEVRFLSTNERKKVPDGHFITVHPGEAVIITSLERLDFKKPTVHKHFPHAMLMALITPTTTMMREGMLQCATKVHAGY
jgi:deoxycytidine triphosphate deaminase